MEYLPKYQQNLKTNSTVTTTKMINLSIRKKLMAANLIYSKMKKCFCMVKTFNQIKTPKENQHRQREDCSMFRTQNFLMN